jgi:hypothetical protein
MTSVINLGLFLAGKTPVNLPFSIDQRETEAIAKSVAPLGIRTVITSRAFMPHLMDFWQGDEGVFIDLKAVVSPPGSLMSLFEKMRAALEPAWLTIWRLDLKKRDPDREAVGLMPLPGDKPVLLTSRELFRDTRRVYAANFVRRDDAIFTEDSTSRPEGLVFGCWGAVLGRGRAVSRSLSQRDDAETLERALLEQVVTHASGTEAFYKSLTLPFAVRSLRYGFVFGPVTSWSLRDLEEQLDLPLVRAWSFGGRIATLSRPDPNIGDAVRHQSQRGQDPKSIGRLLPGYAARIEDGTLKLKLSPDGPWLTGPSEAEIAGDGLVFLLDE